MAPVVPMTFSDLTLKIIFTVSNFPKSYSWQNVAAVSKVKDFLRSQAVKYTVKVIILWKQCKLLLQTTGRN